MGRILLDLFPNVVDMDQHGPVIPIAEPTPNETVDLAGAKVAVWVLHEIG